MSGGTEMKDVTGELPTLEDVQEARKVVRQCMVKISELPPLLAVNLPNIDRCLTVAEQLIRVVEAKKAGG